MPTDHVRDFDGPRERPRRGTVPRERCASRPVRGRSALAPAAASAASRASAAATARRSAALRGCLRATPPRRCLCTNRDRRRTGSLTPRRERDRDRDRDSGSRPGPDWNRATSGSTRGGPRLPRRGPETGTGTEIRDGIGPGLERRLGRRKRERTRERKSWSGTGRARGTASVRDRSRGAFDRDARPPRPLRPPRRSETTGDGRVRRSIPGAAAAAVQSTKDAVASKEGRSFHVRPERRVGACVAVQSSSSRGATDFHERGAEPSNDGALRVVVLPDLPRDFLLSLPSFSLTPPSLPPPLSLPFSHPPSRPISEGWGSSASTRSGSEQAAATRDFQLRAPRASS